MRQSGAALNGVYTMIHVRRTCTSYRCTAYMYHSVNIHRTCTAYMCAVSNILKTTRMYSVNSLRTCAAYMYHSINTPIDQQCRIGLPACGRCAHASPQSSESDLAVRRFVGQRSTAVNCGAAWLEAIRCREHGECHKNRS